MGLSDGSKLGNTVGSALGQCDVASEGAIRGVIVGCSVCGLRSFTLGFVVGAELSLTSG